MKDKIHKNRNKEVEKRKEEREFLKKIHELRDLEKIKGEITKQTMRDNFIKMNEALQQKKMSEHVGKEKERKLETYNFFPFVGQDLVE